MQLVRAASFFVPEESERKSIFVVYYKLYTYEREEYFYFLENPFVGVVDYNASNRRMVCRLRHSEVIAPPNRRLIILLIFCSSSFAVSRNVVPLHCQID